MAKFNATVEFSLTTEMEPEGIYFSDLRDIEGVGEFEDQSYFGIQRVECDGGSLSFEITAEDEDFAREAISERISDGQEYEDHNGFTWLVEDINVDLEEVEWTPTVAEAIDILSDFVENNIHSAAEDNDQRIAKCVRVVLDDHAQLGRRVQSLESNVAALEESVRRLSERLQQIEQPPTQSA